ncbi:MAG: hypothetical protein Roseis2KO_06260 [Roseivirga sp.]
MRTLYIVLVISLYGLGLSDQEVKKEREERVKSIDVPAESRSWLSKTFPAIKKVKWYKEETSGKKSFEAKFRQKGSKYSVEFSEQGVIEDVEVSKGLSDLPESTEQQLRAAFGNFDKFRLIEFQEQWTADTPQLLQQALLNQDSTQITIRYEVVFKAIMDGQHTLWEGLFDTRGQLLSKRKVALRPTDNLDF